MKYNVWTMKNYGEYCPIAMGAEAIGDRWTPLVLRELICGSERFSDIHRGVPRMSRTLLTQRLRHLERIEVIERTETGGYRLTAAGHDLQQVVWGIGDWAMQWLFGDPDEQALRRRARDVAGPPADRGRDGPRHPHGRPVRLPGRRKGRRVWLLLDPQGSTVCERDEGFDVDLWVDVDDPRVHAHLGGPLDLGERDGQRIRSRCTAPPRSCAPFPPGSRSAPSPPAREPTV